VLELLEFGLDGVLDGTVEGGDAGVEEVVDVVWSGVLGAVSFFSSLLAVGCSLPGDGFIFSE
jgi:hypothetical protein